MRLTFLTQWFEPEPAQVRGLALARALARRGFEVEVVTGFPNYPSGTVYPGYQVRPWQREVMSGIPVIRVPLYPSHDGNALRRTVNYASFAASATLMGPLLAKRSDALYVYHPPPTVGVPAAAFKRLWSVPVVYHIADMYPDSIVESGMLEGRTRDLVSGAVGALCDWVYKRCDEITVLSPGFATMLAERGVDPRKIHLVYNWAHEDFRPVEPDESLRVELGIKAGFVVLYAGNMGKMQGLDSVVRAARLLRDLPDVEFAFVGAGTEAEALRDYARSIGATNVHFIGQRPTAEMPAINALADVLLVHLRDLPLFRATIPGKTQASLASGRPIIMAVPGDAAEIVTRAGAGLVVPPEDPEALAEAVRRLRTMPKEMRERMGQKGRDFYVSEMSLDAGADRMATIFQSLGRERQGGPSRCDANPADVG